MKNFVEDLIYKKKKRYKEDYSEMLGDYNRENETVKGYNGRQILELLQNCDDEGAKNILIELSTKNKTIAISNDGTPFSEKGYRSLFIANLSSKTDKKKYIGNKGLGFRSIINWSKAIEIQSNNLSLLYTQESLKLNFNSLFSKEIQNNIRNEEGLADETIPMPFLSMPEIKEIPHNSFTTTIIIHYKEEFLDNIINQIHDITAETLLFLKHIEYVEFKGIEEKENIKCTKESINIDLKEFCPKEKIKFNNLEWEIFSFEDCLPKKYLDKTKKEKELYQIKIAIEKNFNKTSPYLYSFFPTNIKLDQPYILHATFDLDSTRNQINNSEKNIFILERIIEFTIKVAKYYTTESVSYKPLEILNHTHKADTLDNLGYYSMVNDAIKTEAIFPCINNTYESLDKALYISDDFGDMLIKVGAKEILPIHILPIQNLKIKQLVYDLEIDDSLVVFQDSIEIINEISQLNLSTKNRAHFISQIVQECQFIKNKSENECNFLVNNNNEIIIGYEYIYTPITFKNTLSIPTYTNIQFVNSELYDLLLEYLDFKNSGNPNKSRFFYDNLKGFCHIHSYEPTTLAIKIISETNKKIEEEPENAFAYIKEMNKCLFFNYKKTDDDDKKAILKVKIHSISKANKIESINNLCLSSFYPEGNKTAIIFDNIYTDNNYINNPKELGILDYESILEVESFLIWLGVNKYVKYISDNTINENGYFDYVLKYKNKNSSTGSSLSFIKIENIDYLLKQISIENLILWIHFDEMLKKQISNNYNSDVVKNFYYSYETLSNKPSFIKFRIEKVFPYSFKDFLIDDRYQWQNEFVIDYRNKIFTNNGLTKSIINEILILLGAKEDFNDLSIEKVAKILNKIPKYFPNGKNSQSFYKKALNHYKTNNIPFAVPIKLFADNGDNLQLYNQEYIYFSDKIKLPKKLKQNFPVFNFPSRSGGVEAISFFKINDLRNIQIEILEKEIKFIKGNIIDDFNELLNKLKPLILAQRISEIEDVSSKKTQASICNEIKIILCSEINYRVLENIYSVNEYEFLHLQKNTYYVKILENDTLQKLQRNFNFIDSFADIISLSFDVNGDKNEFKNLFINDYEFASQTIINDYGIDTFQEARELLGLADFKQAFWKAIFDLKGVAYYEHLDDLSLEKLIKEKLLIDFDTHSIDYECLNEVNQLYKIETLFEDLEINLQNFAEQYSYPISLENLHFKQIRTIILSGKNLIKSSIWKILENKNIEQQSNFLTEINRFENYESFAKKKSNLHALNFSLPKDIFQQFVISIYGDIELNGDIDVNRVRTLNLKQFSEDEIFDINQNESLKSLIYFTNTIDFIKEVLKRNNETTPIFDDEVNNETSFKNTSITLLDSKNLKSYNPNQKIRNSNKVFTPRIQDNKTLKKIGNTSESIVFDFMKSKPEVFMNLYKVSEDNEGLQYDIRYTNKNNEIKFVEVKTFNNDNFYISKEEFNFGKENYENYEIWLVKNKNEIIPIFDFFTNTKYEPIINEYIVYLKSSDLQ
ncbi:sacsin N-terminal ATP-binding-like domain-containing protein [Elizabethkingia anophelis]|uniref:sacsin N-terminal ATP-binding-like domain-containing protein n=1 Tax=Elizabethkingia anophelis TaxID=1117645 RepID=UPI00301BF8C8